MYCLGHLDTVQAKSEHQELDSALRTLNQLTKELEACQKANLSSDQKQSPTDTEVQDALAVLKGQNQVRSREPAQSRRVRQRPRSLIVYDKALSFSAYEPTVGEQYSGAGLLIQAESPRPKLGIGASILSRQSKESDRNSQECEQSPSTTAASGIADELKDEMQRGPRSSSYEPKNLRLSKVVSLCVSSCLIIERLFYLLNVFVCCS